MNHLFEPSIDDLLLIEENHSIFNQLKPIGAERKNEVHSIQQSSKPFVPIEDAFHSLSFRSDNTFEKETPWNSISSMDHSASTSVDSMTMKFNYQNEVYPRQSLITQNLARASTFGSTTTMDNPISTSKLTRTNLVVSRPSTCIVSSPFSAATTLINPSALIRQMHPSQQELPRYLPRLSGPRERFRINSIGRPIFRTQLHGFHLRR